MDLETPAAPQLGTLGSIQATLRSMSPRRASRSPRHASCPLATPRDMGDALARLLDLYKLLGPALQDHEAEFRKLQEENSFLKFRLSELGVVQGKSYCTLTNTVT